MPSDLQASSIDVPGLASVEQLFISKDSTAAVIGLYLDSPTENIETVKKTRKTGFEPAAFSVTS